jgi:hypothetical protein
MRWREKRDESLQDITSALCWFSDMPSIMITGGEPALHPDLGKIYDLLRDMCPKSHLMIETNAHGQHEVVRKFDEIHVSHYTPKSWPDCKGNTAQVEALRKMCPGAMIGESVHMTPESGKGDKPCARTERAHWSGGLVYGCCVGPGIRGSVGIPLQTGWKEKLKEVKLPCGSCPFGI